MCWACEWCRREESREKACCCVAPFFPRGALQASSTFAFAWSGTWSVLSVLLFMAAITLNQWASLCVPAVLLSCCGTASSFSLFPTARVAELRWGWCGDDGECLTCLAAFVSCCQAATIVAYLGCPLVLWHLDKISGASLWLSVGASFSALVGMAGVDISLNYSDTL